MRRGRRSAGAAVALTGAVAALSVAGAVLAVRNGTLAADASRVDVALGAVVNVTAAAAGVIVLSRSPRHLVGWMLVLMATSSAAHGVLREAAVRALSGDQERHSLALLAG